MTDTDTITVSIREGGEEEEEIIDGDLLEGLSSIVQSARLLRSVCGNLHGDIHPWIAAVPAVPQPTG
jgi:hypothetical protein